MTHGLRPLSSNNPRIKQLGRLARRSGERDEQRALLVEGQTLLDTAISAGAVVREVYVDTARASDPSLVTILDRLDPEVPRWEVPAGTLDRAGDVATSQGVLAVVERPEEAMPEADGSGFVLVLAELADPGNVGTIMRAAVAGGAAAVVVGGGADPTAPKVVRASAGACFAVPVVRSVDGDSALTLAADAGFRLVGAVVSGGRDHDEVDLTGSVAIVVGNEARGLSSHEISRLDELVSIAMDGPTESLNVAMAATILTFEAARQRRRT